MRLLLLNLDSIGEFLAFGLRAAKAGHEVRIWFERGNNPETGKGFDEITIVENWLGSAKWADLIIPSGNHKFLQKLDQLRKSGMKVFGPTVASADLEIKRAEGMQFFEAAGISVPEYKKFTSLKDAEAHVRKTGERYVFKVLGDEDDKSLSYVSKTPADMIARLQRWDKLGMQPKGAFILQKVIDGIEVGISRSLGSRGWVGPPNLNWENKKLLSGGCGQNCGEAGTITRFVAEDDKLFKDVLAPCEKALLALGHIGDVDVNCIVADDGKAWPLEWTCRPGFPAENLLIATTVGDPVQWRLDACNGKDTLKVSNKICCGVVVAQPDYPYYKLEADEVTGIPVYGVSKSNENYLYPQSITRMKLPDMDGKEVVDKNIWATSGAYLIVVTGTGKTVRQASTRCYDTINEISIPDKSYRDDIGERLEEDIPKLQRHGYCEGWSYE
jgi:phosphoribosylamine---glycine ligase